MHPHPAPRRRPAARLVLPLACGLAIAAGPAARGCEPAEARPVVVSDVLADGDLVTPEGVLRLAGIAWPGPGQAAARARARAGLKAALAGAELSAVAGRPDRWGRLTANLFVREAGGPWPAFWLQAGMVEHGLVRAWPEAGLGRCWAVLQRHERLAREAGAGLWAEPVQGAGEEGEGGTEPTVGRRITTIGTIRSVRESRGVWFINLDQEGMSPITVMLDRRLVRRMKDGQQKAADLTGRTIAVRAVLRAGQRPRQVVERPEQMEILE